MPRTSAIDRSIVLSCDLALCLAKTGQSEEARAVIASVPNEVLGRCTPDDQVVAAAALGTACHACDLADEAAYAEERLASARKDHEEIVAVLQKTLLPFGAAATFNLI